MNSLLKILVLIMSLIFIFLFLLLEAHIIYSVADMFKLVFIQAMSYHVLMGFLFVIAIIRFKIPKNIETENKSVSEEIVEVFSRNTMLLTGYLILWFLATVMYWFL